MSRLVEFRKLEQQLAEQLAELESMKSDSGLKKKWNLRANCGRCWPSTASA